LIYTLDNDVNISDILGDNMPKELHLSGDIMSHPDNKNYINFLKGKGVDVKILGPVV